MTECGGRAQRAGSAGLRIEGSGRWCEEELRRVIGQGEKRETGVPRVEGVNLRLAWGRVGEK